MLVLIIDTSLKGPLLALADANLGQLLQQVVRSERQEAAADLPALTMRLLQEQQVTWKDVAGIIIGNGPGSFTGLKIALSFVYGLHRAQPHLGFYAVSAFGSLARFNKQDFDLWVLPATSVCGYYAHRLGCGVLDLEKHFQAEPSLVRMPQHLAVFGTWERLNSYQKTHNFKLSHLQVDELGSEILMSMLQDFIANAAQLSEDLPIPIYLRKSAPEEKAARERIK